MSKGQLGDNVIEFSQEPVMYAPVTWASCIRKSEILKPLHSILAKENNPFISELLLTRHLTSSHQVANKASTLCRQPALSADAVDISLQLLHPALSLSFSAVFLHVVLSLPRLRRRSGARIIAFLQSLSYPFLIMCPKNFHLLLLISSPMVSISAISITSLLVILSCQHIR